VPGHGRGAQNGADQPYGNHRPSRREQSRQCDATRHPKGEASHHQPGPDVEAADPAPQDAAWHGNCDHEGKQEARRRTGLWWGVTGFGKAGLQGKSSVYAAFPSLPAALVYPAVSAN
jgi:hypothetical protein